MHQRDLPTIHHVSRRALATAWAGLCLLLSLPANADVTLTYEQNGDNAQAFDISIKPPMMRMNEASGMWMLYDSSIDTMFAIVPERKSYTRLNRDRAAMMGGMIGAAKSQMQEMMKNMTPEQRAMMEQSMGSMMPKEAPKTTYKDTGETRTVDRKKCRVKQLLVNGKMEHEFCIAAPKSVGVAPEEYAVMLKIYDLMSAMRDAAGSYFSGAFPDPNELKGVAIENRSASGEHYKLSDVSHKKLDSSMFKLPGDYKEEAIPSVPPSFNQ